MQPTEPTEPMQPMQPTQPMQQMPPMQQMQQDAGAVDKPMRFERRCPTCGQLGAYAGADRCNACDVALVAVRVDDKDDGPIAPVFVYRPWVVGVLAVIAVAFPFLPIPFLGGVAGLGLKLCASAAIVKIIRDYRENMK